MDYLENIAKIFFYFAGPSVACMALFTWKRELKGKSKHDIAKQILGLIIAVRSRLKVAQLRSKFVGSPKNKLACYNWLSESHVKAAELAVEVEIHWGNSEAEAMKNLCEKLFDIRFVANTYEPITVDTDPDYNQMKEFESVLNGSDNEFNLEIENLFSTIELKFKKFVQ